MPVQTPELILNRIERLNEGLSQSVKSTGGADFAMLLSMISASQQQANGLTTQTSQQDAEDRVGRFQLAAENEAVSSRDQLYQPETLARLNDSLRKGYLGDFHLLLSWLDTVPLEGRVRRFSLGPSTPGVGFSQAAVLGSGADLLAKSGYLMLDEIERSSHLVAA